MTFGRPFFLLLVFSVPLLIGNLFQQAYNLADSVIVGRFIGSGALAAVGATSSVTFLFFSVCNGISSGGGILTAQFFGADEEDRVRKAISNSAYIMLAGSVIMGMAAFILSPTVLRMLETPEDILSDAVLYMRMMSAGVPLVAVYNYTASMLRALGDSRTPLYFLILACFLNVGLDLLCVALLHLGVFGAALATLIAQFIAGAACLLYAFRTNPYFRLNRSHLEPDSSIIKSAVRLGLPLAMQWSMIAVSTTALQAVVNSFGTAAVAAFTATSRVEQLIHQPFGSLGTALSTYAGQNYGAGRNDRVRRGLRDSFLMCVVFSAVMLVLMQLGSRWIMNSFVDDADVVALGARALRMTSIFYLFLGLIYITRGTLNGVGDTLFSFINGVIEMVCRIFLPVALIRLTTAGVWSIWWTAGMTWGISSVFCVLRYYTWTRKHPA